MLQYFMKIIFILLFFISALFSSTGLNSECYPKTYAQLGTPLFEAVSNFTALRAGDLLSNQKQNIADYIKQVDSALKTGKALDTENANEMKSYLKELRKIQILHDKIQKSYKQTLYKSINDKNQDLFYSLLQFPLAFLKEDARLKKKVVGFYRATKNDRKSNSTRYLIELSQDLELDQSSYAYVNNMFKTVNKNQTVQEEKSLTDFKPNSLLDQPVQIISIRTKNGFDLYLENHAYYDVSIELKAVKLLNLSSSKPLPYIGSFPAQSRTKILHFSIKDTSKASSSQILYNSTMGRLNPNYDKDYLYALPFSRGKSYVLTQGFNSKYTHTGQSAYALDFKMDEGTKVHAMRDGIVVAVEDKHTEHGYSPAFANKSNYIVIQHEDGSMAMYGHLKPKGVKVKLGQQVYKHAFIGISGNTGYSSGPHLHVHISVLPNIHSGTTSIPFYFLSKQGKISSPVERSFYIAK